MKIADYIASQLFNAGVRRVFGIPGGPSIPYLEAFSRAGIEFILTSNEASAGIMADVTARLTGVPGICHATFGPGATNITTGTGGAMLDRSPVIVFTSEIEDMMIRRTVQMNIDHQKLFEPITKATFRLNAGNVHEVLKSALDICRKEYPGPVHIGLPADIADEEMGDSPEIHGKADVSGYSNDIPGIVSMLEQSRMPLLAIGLTAKRCGIQAQLLSFLESYKVPCVITPMAKGLIPEDHPSYTGVLFHALSDYLEDIYEKCDLIIGLGYDPVEYNYESWMPDVPLIHFNTMETDLPPDKNAVQYIGNAEEWFEILKNINQGSLISSKSIIEGIRNEMTSVFEGFTGHFGPVAALKILQDELPADSIITFDVGSHLHVAGQYWRTNGRQNLLMTNGWSGMGFGIPAAIAAQINSPGSTVACITGDGGFLMMAGEMVTARRYNLPVIVVVFSDGELNLIKLKQSWKDLPANGTVLYRGDLFGADVFLGVKVLKADSQESMSKAIIAALSLKEPVIINAIIDPEDYKLLIVKK
jgi:acetolactate synthase-1/2/3 large subunit